MLKLTMKAKHEDDIEEVKKFPSNAVANLLGSSIIVMLGTEILFKVPENEVSRIEKDSSTIDTKTDN